MTPRPFHPLSHPEDTLQIVPGEIRGGHSSVRQRRVTMRASGRGAGTLRMPDHPREQRVLVKPTVVPAGTGRGKNWFKHGTYLQREGVQGGGRGVGFDGERDVVSVSQTLGQWQRAGDPHLFKVILSPEHALELEIFTRRFMAEKVAPDLGQPLQWVAIVHRNTATPHVHLLVRGRDAAGQGMRIDGGYLWGGLRQRARELATQMLGWRGADEIAQEQEHTVMTRRWTRLDEALSRKRDGRWVAVDDTLTPAERARLAELERRGLAWRVDATRWEMSQHWEAQQMTSEHYRVAQEQDDKSADTAAQKELEQLREEQERQRRVRIIDQWEHEQELER
jgi:hypothetical protein